MKKNTVKKIISIFLAFVSSVFLVLLSISATLLLCFSKPYVKADLKYTNYGEKAEKEIIDELESYAIPGGLPEDFFAEGLDKAELEKNIDYAVDCAYSGDGFEVIGFGETLLERINRYATEVFGTAEQDITGSINNLVAFCTNSYKAYTYSLIVKYVGIAGRYIGWIAPFSLALAGLAVALLFLFLYKINKDGFYIRIALNSAGLMLALPSVVILASGIIGKIGITSECLFGFTTFLLYSVLTVMLICSVICFLTANIKVGHLIKK